MAYFYVRDNGTFVGTKATSGGDGTARTGAWDATVGNSFPSIAAAIDTGLAGSGDVIVVADDHNFTTSSTYITYTGPATLTAVPLIIVSVDVTSQNTPKAGGKEGHVTSGQYMYLNGALRIHGMTFEPARSVRSTAGSRTNFYNCTINNGKLSNGYGMWPSGNGSFWKFFNCGINWNGNGANQYITIYRSGQVWMYGGSFTNGTSSGEIIRSSGGSLRFYGVDFSGSQATYVIDDTINDETYSNKEVLLSGCRLPTGLTALVNKDSVAVASAPFIFIGCGTTSAEAEYQYYYTDGRYGEVEATTSIYRDDSTGWDSGEKTSLKVTTTAECSEHEPFHFPLPSFFATLSSTSTDKLTAYLCIDNVTVYDTDLWMYLSYQDGTNNHTYNWDATSTAVVQAKKTFANGTELTTNTKTWKDSTDTAPPTGWTSIKKYEVSIDTASGAGGDPGADAMIIPWMHVQKASATFYVCPEFGEGT